MPAQTSANKGSGIKKFGRFLKAVRSELKKVIWPNRKELINNTVVVIVSVTLVIIALWVLDSIFGLALNLIIG
ncbi:MAG: preprotein translocase subunit SecE [Candidatus Alkaliphilus sp. MAG34]|nr:preprotein translocase subunit SecE [Clostridiales bacterium]